MARINPADREELALHIGAGGQRAAEAPASPEPGELARELRHLQDLLQGKDSNRRHALRRTFKRITPKMQAAAINVRMTFDEKDTTSVLARSAGRQHELASMLEKDVLISEEPAMVCELRPLSIQLQMPMEDVLLGREVFQQFDQDSDGSLDVNEFETAALELLRMQNRAAEAGGVQEGVREGVASRLAEISRQLHAQASSGGVSLQAFLTWYARCLTEGVLATDSKRITELAEQHAASADYVFRLKRSFDACCGDHPGILAAEGFPRLLQKALRVPPQLELPSGRVQHLWGELAGGASGRVGFEAFLRWWVRYFSEEDLASEAPFEAFYSSVRRIGWEYLDPPVPLTPVHVEHEPEKPRIMFRRRTTGEPPEDLEPMSRRQTA